MRANSLGNNGQVNNQPLPGQIPPRTGIPTQGGANPAAAIARESFGNRVAYWVERASYAAPFVIMALTPILASTADHYLRLVTYTAAAFFGGGLVAKMAQEYQPNVERGFFRHVVAYGYMGLGLAALLSKAPGEKLVNKLHECPAGLELWNNVENTLGPVTVVTVPQEFVVDSRNQFLISKEMNQVNKMSRLVKMLCASAPQKGIGIPRFMVKPLLREAQEGNVSKEAYFSTWREIMLSIIHCWEEVTSECGKTDSWNIFAHRNYDSAYEKALLEKNKDLKMQMEYYDEWDVKYKTAFCDKSPDHADCLVAEMAQEYQQNVERDSLRHIVADDYMRRDLMQLLSKAGSERLVGKLHECPAGLDLWNNVENRLSPVTVVTLPEELVDSGRTNQFLISKEMNQDNRLSELVAMLCTHAPQKGIGVPSAMFQDLIWEARQGKVSKEAYLSTWGKVALSVHHCRENVMNECIKTGSWDFFRQSNYDYLYYDSLPEEALEGFIADPSQQQRFYDEWKKNYKTAFCDKSPDHADCQSLGVRAWWK